MMFVVDGGTLHRSVVGHVVIASTMPDDGAVGRISSIHPSRSTTS
jgi:hypothetical protein